MRAIIRILVAIIFGAITLGMDYGMSFRTLKELHDTVRMEALSKIAQESRAESATKFPIYEGTMFFFDGVHPSCSGWNPKPLISRSFEKVASTGVGSVSFLPRHSIVGRT